MSSTLHDVTVVAASLLAVSVLVLAARAAGRSGRVPAPLLRKALHAAVGAGTLVFTPMFHHLAWAVVPPLLFGAVNLSGRSRALLPGMAETPAQARGLWTFPLGVVLTYLFFWEEGTRRAILAGLVALAFADPIASIVGTRYGQRRLRGFGHGRTLEGSLAFFLVAAVGVGIVAAGSACGAYPWRMGVACGLAGAAAESLTPSGWDNVTIPLAVAAAYRFLG